MIVPDKQRKIEKAVSTDYGRPALENPFLVFDGEQGLLCATDTYQCVMIPVTTDDEDTAGAVPLDAIKASRRKTSDGRIELAEKAATVRGLQEFADGEAHYARHDQKNPDLLKIRDNTIALGDPVITIGINATMLAKIQAALGADGRGISLEIRNPLKPVIVRPLGGRSGMGIAMPIMMDKR